MSPVGRTMLIMTAPSWSPPLDRPRSSAIPSSVSCTGISSSTVTKCTAVSGERITRCTVSAWARIGPTLASPDTSDAILRKRLIRPVGGASITTAS